MNCKVPYIEKYYRQQSPKLADRLTDVYHSVWKEITGSKLFRKYTEGNSATYLFSSNGTAQNQKQRNLVNSINERFGAKVVKLEPTKSGMNSKVTVDVHPIAKTEYNKLNPQQVMFSKKANTVSSKASPETVKVIKDMLTRMGIDFQTVSNIVVNGIRQEANGAALIMQKLVQVVEGKDDVALTEEAMHFVVEILEQKDPKLFNQLLKEINNYNMLKEVMAEYGADPNYQIDGKPNIRKLKKEAIAKVLAEVVISKMEGVTEKPELLAKAQTWWQKFIEMFKNLLISSGFDTAAIKVITGEAIGTAEDIRAEESDVFLQSTKSKQDTIFDTIKNISNSIKKDDDGYSSNGRKIPRRVTDLVSDWYDRIFKSGDIEKSDYAKAFDDLRAEKGTAGHSDIEHAFKMFVDENGYLRPEPLDDSEYVSQLDPNSRDFYELLRDNLEARLKSFGPNTRFMSEVIVYDAKRNMAGTIDFIAIQENGKINVLDWKFMNLNTEKYSDVPWYKVASWNLQMEQYQLILKNMLNVKNDSFGQTRMIPIIAEYEGANPKEGVLPFLSEIRIGDVNVQNITEDYLIPVGLESESSGDDKIDKLIDKLNAVYAKLSKVKALPSQKLSKAEQLNALFSAVRQLQMKKNIKPLIYQAKVLSKQIQATIDEFNNAWKGLDPKNIDVAAINKFTNTIMDAEEAIQTYATLDTDLRFLFQGELSEEDKQLREDLRQASDKARDLAAELVEVKNQFAEETIAKKQGVEKMLTPEKIVKGISKWFASTSNIQIKAVQTLYKMANKAFGYAAQDTIDETQKLAKLQEAFLKMAASKGLDSKNMFNMLMKKGKNELIDQYNTDFYTQLNQAIGKRNFEWILANIDIPKYNKFLKEKIEEEIQYINDKARVEEGEEREKIIEREIKKVRERYDTSTQDGRGWLQYDLIKKYPVDSWESAEWKELVANKPAKDFYDYIIERNKYYTSIGYIHAKQTRVFLPWVRKGMMEKIMMGGKVSLGEQFLRSISVDEGDIGYGEIDPLTGRPINKVPIYFTSEIEGEYSTDLFKTMALYNEMAIKFKHLSDIEAQARLLISVERNKKAIATSAYGKTVYKDGVIQYTPDNNDNTQILEDMVKAIVYGQKFIESETFDQLLGKIGNVGEKLNDKLDKLGIKYRLFPENLAGRQISVNKVINQLNNTFQLNALGLNVLSASSNLLGGTAQSIINAGTYFTAEDYAATEYWLTMAKMQGDNKNMKIAALQYFLPLSDATNRELVKKLSVSKLTQEGVQDFLMILMKNSDEHVQTVNFFSFLRNSIVVDGEVVNAREYLRSQPEYKSKYQGTAQERKAFKDKFEKDVLKLINEKGVLAVSKIENGELVIPGVNRKSDSVLELRRKVQSLTKNALGNLSEDDVRKINLNVYGKSFMLFKNWIPRLADVRYGNLKYNSASDAYEWGRMRNVFRIMSEDITHSLGNLYSILKGNDRGAEFMRQLYEKKKADYEADTGKELEMDDTMFMDLVTQNVKAQMLDLITLLTLVSLYAGVKAYQPDDDDESKNAHKFFVKATDKFKDELLYFYNPTSVMGLVSNGVFPAMALIDNYGTVLKNFMLENYYIATGDQEAAEDNFVLKYTMRSVPGASAFASWLPIFLPDAAKELGIRSQSQYGIR